MYSTDSRHTSDYEDTDTEGGAYTDQELDETLNDEVGRVLVFLFFSVLTFYLIHVRCQKYWIMH